METSKITHLKQTNMKYYLINGKIMKGGEMPIELPSKFYSTNICKEERKKDLDNLIKAWYSSLQPCEISESELDKVKVYLYEHTRHSFKEPIEVNNIIEEKESISNLDSFITFKAPTKEDKEIDNFSIDRLVGWFRKRVSIKDHEVDYLKFVMREYNSLNKK